MKAGALSLLSGAVAVGTFAVLAVFDGPPRIPVGDKAATYSKFDCARDVSILREAASYMEKTAEILHNRMTPGTFMGGMAAEQDSEGKMWKVRKLSACAERARLALLQYQFELAGYVGGERVEGWEELNPAAKEVGRKMTRERVATAKANLNAEINRVAEAGY